MKQTFYIACLNPEILFDIEFEYDILLLYETRYTYKDLFHVMYCTCYSYMYVCFIPICVFYTTRAVHFQPIYVIQNRFLYLVVRTMINKSYKMIKYAF